ncbi:MAG: asparaginase domain-containing protein [Candidatus Eisenbacteria bacterium]|nr:asparaginase domain-containing protein [Candidatus Eisenbacteria bacterium]
MNAPRRIALLSTGGTIEKTYNESDGTLANQRSVLEIMLASLVLHGVVVDRIPVMNVDSLTMTDADHERIVRVAAAYAESHDGILITHGTDRLAITGELLVERLGDPPAVPIVLTGAMRPYELRNTDAMQNLTEALLAVQILPRGVYVVMHNTALRFPGVVKDHQRMTFRKPDDQDSGEGASRR